MKIYFYTVFMSIVLISPLSIMVDAQFGVENNQNISKENNFSYSFIDIYIEEYDAATEIAYSTLIEYIPFYNIISDVEKSFSSVLIIITHGTENGIRYNGVENSFQDFSEELKSVNAPDIFLLSCYSSLINQFSNNNIVHGFTGDVDAYFGALFILKSLGIDVSAQLGARISQLASNPETMVPLADQDNNPGSTFDFSPDEYGMSSSTNYLTGTGGFYFEIIVDTWFKADQQFIDYYQNNPSLAYVHEIEIRKSGMTTSHIFGYYNSEVISNDISGSSAGIDHPDCILGWCVDEADDPEFEWTINDPEDLTLGQVYNLKFRYYTDNNPTCGEYEYKLLLTAEVDGEGLLYGIYYYTSARKYDLLMWGDPFPVKVPCLWIVTYTFSGNGFVFQQLTKSAISFHLDADIPTYVDIEFTINEFGNDPWVRFVYLYRDSTLVYESTISSTNTFKALDILLVPGYGADITIVIYSGAYAANTYALKTVAVIGYFNSLSAYGWQSGTLSSFI